MNGIRRARVAAALVLALPLAHLVATASLLAGLPDGRPAWLSWSPAGGKATVAYLVLAGLALAPVASPARPLGAWTGLCAAACGLALYGWSNLDWTLVAADAGLARGGLPGPVTLAAAASPFVVVLVHAAWEERIRLRVHLESKGADAAEVAAAASAVLPEARRRLVLAAGLWIAVVVAFTALAGGSRFLRPLAERAPLLVVVAVAALLAYALAALRRESAA